VDVRDLKSGAEGIRLRALSDTDLAVSKQFGIAFKSPQNYDKVLPETSNWQKM